MLAACEQVFASPRYADAALRLVTDSPVLGAPVV